MAQHKATPSVISRQTSSCAPNKTSPKKQPLKSTQSANCRLWEARSLFLPYVTLTVVWSSLAGSGCKVRNILPGLFLAHCACRDVHRPADPGVLSLPHSNCHGRLVSSTPCSPDRSKPPGLATCLPEAWPGFCINLLRNRHTLSNVTLCCTFSVTNLFAIHILHNFPDLGSILLPLPAQACLMNTDTTGCNNP